MRRRVLKRWVWLILIGWIGSSAVAASQLCFHDIGEHLAAAVTRAVKGPSAPEVPLANEEEEDQHCADQPPGAADDHTGNLSMPALGPTTVFWLDVVDEVARSYETPSALIALSRIPAYFVAHRLRF